MPFVRIGMAGIPVDELGQGSRPVERVVGAVLNLDQADELASGLRSVMAHEPWGVAALANPARAIWRETSALSEGDMLVAGLGARITGGETIRLVRMDFTGIWLGGPTPDDQQLYTQGALFPDPVQLCSLISSVKKCVKAIRTASSTPSAEPRRTGLSRRRRNDGDRRTKRAGCYRRGSTLRVHCLHPVQKLVHRGHEQPALLVERCVGAVLEYHQL